MWEEGGELIKEYQPFQILLSSLFFHFIWLLIDSLEKWGFSAQLK